MKCDICGQEIGRPVVVDTRSEGPSTEYSSNKTVSLAMCAACADRRRATQRTFAWGIGLLVTGLVLVAIWISLFG